MIENIKHHAIHISDVDDDISSVESRPIQLIKFSIAINTIYCGALATSF
jgi:hypothetical protein